MKIDLTELIVAMIGLLASIITAYLVPWIKRNTSDRQQKVIGAWVSVAIQAAEQLYGSGSGVEKKAYVMRYLKEKGFSVDDTVVEAYVYKLLHEKKERNDDILSDEV